MCSFGLIISVTLVFLSRAVSEVETVRGKLYSGNKGVKLRNILMKRQFINGDTCIQEDLIIYYIYLRVSEGKEIKYPRRVKHCKIDLGI